MLFCIIECVQYNEKLDFDLLTWIWKYVICKKLSKTNISLGWQILLFTREWITKLIYPLIEFVCKYVYIISYLCKQIIVSEHYMQSDILVCNNNKSHTFAEYDTLKYVNAFNCEFFYGFICIYLSIFLLNHLCNSPLCFYLSYLLFILVI